MRDESRRLSKMQTGRNNQKEPATKIYKTKTFKEKTEERKKHRYPTCEKRSLRCCWRYSWRVSCCCSPVPCTWWTLRPPSRSPPPPLRTRSGFPITGFANAISSSSVFALRCTRDNIWGSKKSQPPSKNLSNSPMMCFALL